MKKASLCISQYQAPGSLSGGGECLSAAMLLFIVVSRFEHGEHTVKLSRYQPVLLHRFRELYTSSAQEGTGPDPRPQKGSGKISDLPFSRWMPCHRPADPRPASCFCNITPYRTSQKPWAFHSCCIWHPRTADLSLLLLQSPNGRLMPRSHSP